MVKHQREFVVLKTTSNVKGLLKSGGAPIYRSLMTSLLSILYMDFFCRAKRSNPSLLQNCLYTTFPFICAHTTVLYTYMYKYKSKSIQGILYYTRMVDIKSRNRSIYCVYNIHFLMRSSINLSANLTTWNQNNH